VAIFTPLLLQADLLQAGLPQADLPHADLLAARSSLLVDLALLPGIAAAIALVDRWGRIPLQIIGFIGCAAALLLAAGGQLLLGLLLFQFMTNLGPNAQTYLMAGELFPTPVRGLGAGFAAAAGKVGAVLTAVALPLLLSRWGDSLVLSLLAVTSLLGAAVTWCWRLEPMGRELDSVASSPPP
jgi:putative MFS transporter